MSAILDYMRLCRLCLVKDKVNVPIFGETSDIRQIFLKISACLPVKVSQDDNLPKNICDSCLYKVDLLYQFWNTTVNAEKQLIQWLAEIGVDVNIKNTNPPQLRLMPQSHAHPHSMPETIILKEERPDPEIKAMEHGVQNFQMETQQTLYPGFENPYQPQVKMTVGAPTDFSQATEAPAEEEVKVPQQQPQPTKPTPAKRRGRPPKAKNSPAPKIAPPPPAAPKSPPIITTSKRRSSAAAAAAAVAAAAANASSDDSDIDDRFGDDSDDDMDGRIAKEEADSDEDYVDNSESLEPTTFVGVPSTSASDPEQPGPSGLSGGSTTGKKSSALPVNAANETGPQPQLMVPTPRSQIIGYVPVNLLLNPYCCKVCGERFETPGKLNSHRSKHFIRNKPCNECGKQFKTNTQLKHHTQVVHEKIVLFRCDLCDKKYATKVGLDLHLRRHKNDYVSKCSECDKTFYSKKEAERHMKVLHQGLRYVCFPCNKAFRDEHYLKVHQREKHDPDYIPEEKSCQECGETFFNKNLFLTHIKQHKASTFICDICGKVVSTLASLRHHKMIHSGAKPYVCHTCGKAFNKKTLLKIHTRTHTKEKPHKCSVCEKCFTQRSTLVIHLRYHSGERPYSCNICQKAFVSKNLMKLHSKVHGTALADINK